MMRLISGQPGNGKSLRALFDMVAEYERNKSANALDPSDRKWEPLREFYTNMVGATREENPEAFEWVQRIPEHNDWRALPNGSYVLYDEAHSDGNTEGLERYGLLFPSTGKPGESQDPRIRAMSTHRHRGFDLVFVTQWPSKIHHNVRSLCGSHTHMNRAMGLASAGVLSWSRVQVDPYDEREREKAEEEIWGFPKDLYKRYRSATLHTSSHKFKIPKKVWSGLSMLVVFCLVGWGLYLFFRPDPAVSKPKHATALTSGSLLPRGPGAGGAAVTTTEPVAHPGTGNFASVDAPRVQGLMGCLDTPRHCRCWSRDGHLIDQTRAECEKLVADGIPFDLVVADRGNSRSGSGGPVSGAAVGDLSPGDAFGRVDTAEASMAQYGGMGHGPSAATMQTAVGVSSGASMPASVDPQPGDGSPR